MEADALALPDPDACRAALGRRRDRILAAWHEAGLGDGVVLVPSGLVLPVEGSDQHYGFRAHDTHYYLAGCRGPGQVLACDPAAGDGGDAWILFGAVPSQDDRVWHGDPPSLEERAEGAGLPTARPVAELGTWLGARAARPVALLGSRDVLERPAGYALHPERVAALGLDAALSERLAERVVAARRVKDDVEVGFLRAAAAATARGHRAAMEVTAPGLTEWALQVELEAAFLRAGAERAAYPSIAVAGPHAATLHATPGSRAMEAGDLVLVDAGAEVAGYDADVTRVWPVAPAFSAEQRAIYEIVLEVQKRAVAAVQPGVEFRDLHMQAAHGLAVGLVDLGLLRGRPEDLVARDAHAIFFPHGVGHLLGLATHDVGGNPHDRPRSERPGLRYLRIDLPLEARFVVTIEPGIYFVDALLGDPDLRREHADTVDWARVDGMRGFGGVRIEDDVLVRAGAPEVLSAAIPKEIDAVEALRR